MFSGPSPIFFRYRYYQHCSTPADAHITMDTEEEDVAEESSGDHDDDSDADFDDDDDDD